MSETRLLSRGKGREGECGGEICRADENRDAGRGGLLKEGASRGRGGLYLSKMAISQDVAAEAQLVVKG